MIRMIGIADKLEKFRCSFMLRLKNMSTHFEQKYLGMGCEAIQKYFCIEDDQF